MDYPCKLYKVRFIIDLNIDLISNTYFFLLNLDKSRSKLICHVTITSGDHTKFEKEDWYWTTLSLKICLMQNLQNLDDFIKLYINIWFFLPHVTLSNFIGFPYCLLFFYYFFFVLANIYSLRLISNNSCGE